MGIYFEVILLIALIASGLITLIDKRFFEKDRLNKATQIPNFMTIDSKQQEALVKPPFLADYARSLFPVFLIVFILRGFIFELYEVPSGSMLPTIQIGDYFLVDKFSYGIHVPVFDQEIIKTGLPERGDVVIFHHPVNRQVDLIKTVVGLPGDHISYINKQLYLNGKPYPTQFIDQSIEPNNLALGSTSVMQYHQQIGDHWHDIFTTPTVKCVGMNDKTVRQNALCFDFQNLVVPQGEYLVMGDNRDNSDDGRDWGFVPAQNIVGKPLFIIFSWNSITHSVRWSRIGTKIP